MYVLVFVGVFVFRCFQKFLIPRYRDHIFGLKAFATLFRFSIFFLLLFQTNLEPNLIGIIERKKK